MAFNLEIELTRLERLVGSQTREIERTRQEELTGKQTLEKLRRAQVPPSLGTRYVQMDSKGRIVLAAPVRRSLGTPIIATRAARRSILLLPAPLWATILNDLDGDACDFYASGAFGLVINRVIAEKPIAALLTDSKGGSDAADRKLDRTIPVFLGGPVQLVVGGCVTCGLLPHLFQHLLA